MSLFITPDLFKFLNNVFNFGVDFLPFSVFSLLRLLNVFWVYIVRRDFEQPPVLNFSDISHKFASCEDNFIVQDPSSLFFEHVTGRMQHGRVVGFGGFVNAIFVQFGRIHKKASQKTFPDI